MSQNDRIIRKPEVMALLGLSKSTVHERINAGLLLPPFQLGCRAVGWLESEILQLMVAMAAGICDELLVDLNQYLLEERQRLWAELRK
ncbi:AlpA family phage regulatory protein [Shewanella cyperi]|nr:AlpA family phage regulatory protein [Shewanella cyperi]